MRNGISLTVIPGKELTEKGFLEILALCSEAYETDFSPIMQSYGEHLTHVLLHSGTELAGHALWVARWLQAGDMSLMKTAYVEAVAVAPKQQGKGYATAVMKKLAESIDDYELAALSPSDAGFYERLGWELWRGKLYARKEGVIIPAKNESRCMILRLPETPVIDIDMPLSIEWRRGDIW